MISRAARRFFSTILPTGEKAERELSSVEREFLNIKESHFSRLGLYRKKETNYLAILKLFQLAQRGRKADYSACLFAVNHFYNFGVELDNHELTSRWLALAIEVGRLDEAVQVIKLWNAWLSSPPSIKLVEIVIQMVRVEQSRDLLKSIRECWQLPLSEQAYASVISKEIALGRSDSKGILEAYLVWNDSKLMDVILPSKTLYSLSCALKSIGEFEKADEINFHILQESLGGLPENPFGACD